MLLTSFKMVDTKIVVRSTIFYKYIQFINIYIYYYLLRDFLGVLLVVHYTFGYLYVDRYDDQFDVERSQQSFFHFFHDICNTRRHVYDEYRKNNALIWNIVWTHCLRARVIVSSTHPKMCSILDLVVNDTPNIPSWRSDSIRYTLCCPTILCKPDIGSSWWNRSGTLAWAWSAGRNNNKTLQWGHYIRTLCCIQHGVGYKLAP